MSVCHSLTRPSLWSRICYEINGPTTLHLQHELGLLVTLTFLTTASLISLYRTTFGTVGDFAYLLLSSLWLSRHLVFRFLVTTDTCCTGNPLFSWNSLRHGLVRVIHLTTAPGQYFDHINGFGPINTPIDMSGVSSNNAHPKDRSSKPWLLGMLLNLLSSVVAFVVTVLRWTQRYFVIKGVFSSLSFRKNEMESTSENTFTKKHERRASMDHSKNVKQNTVHSGVTEHSDANPNDNMFFRIYEESRDDVGVVLKRLTERIPSSFICILIGTVLWMVYFFIYILPLADEYLSGIRHFYWGFTSPWNGSLREFHKSFFSPRRSFNRMHTSAHRVAQRQIIDYVTRISIYDQLEQSLYNRRLITIATSFFPWINVQLTSVIVMLTLIGLTGTLTSILFFGAVLPPLPDLLSPYFYGNHLFSKIGGNPYSMKLSKPSNKQANDKGSYADSVKRHGDACLIMHVKVIVMRVIENAVVCAILPHSRYVCKYTSHCYKEPMIWEVDGIMGITGVQGNDMFNSINCDYSMYRLIFFTVCFITVSQMIAQMLTLDRSHLAMYAFQSTNTFSLGDNNVQMSRKGSNLGQKINVNNNTDDWYIPPQGLTKKGFILEVTKFFSSTIDKIWKQIQHVLSYERSRISASRVIAVCSQLHAMLAVFLLLVYLTYLISGKTSFSLMLIFIAIFNSAGCMDIGLSNIDEFVSLAEEVKM